jgi:predicted Zn finger-like uncharacterized protein
MTFTVSCPSCDTSFPVDPAKVPEGGVRAQCNVCPEIFDVDHPAEAIATGPFETDEFVAPEPVAPPSPEPAESSAPIRFGRRSPEDKARSLARSLVSDLVAYNPEKHKEALAAGTLKEVFGEEIEKSLKEYEQQVEADVVGRPSIFNDALNSILAEGQSVFNVDQ